MAKKKVYSTSANFKSFNVRKVDSCDETFERIRSHAFNILHRHGLPYNQWDTVVTIKHNLKKSWNYDFAEKDVDFYFRRWWLDRVIQEFGLMIWNDVNAKYYNDWFHNGNLVDLPHLPKKQRRSGEGVAGHLADEAVREFESIFE